VRFILIILVLLLSISGCSSSAIWSPSLENTVSFSEEFSPEEKLVILKGFNVWGRETACKANFVETADGTIAIKKTTDQELIAFELKEGKKIIGLSIQSDNPTIYFIFQKIDTALKLELVAAHEAGHMLGMEHIPQKQVAIMNPAVNSLILEDHLTQYDLDQFDNYWRCK